LNCMMMHGFVNFKFVIVPMFEGRCTKLFLNFEGEINVGLLLGLSGS